MKTQVLICTFGSGIERIDAQALPRVPGVSWLVCCQNPEGLDLSASRAALESHDDIETHVVGDSGLSNNRNHAFDLASGDILLIADDDLIFNPDGLAAIGCIFEEEPATDFITLHAATGVPRAMPPDGHDLAKPFPHYCPISFEIAVRAASLARSGVRFSPLAGIGAPYLCAGEEELFVHNLLKAGLHGRYADIAVATHPGATTSERLDATPAMMRTKGALMRSLRGTAAALVRLPVEAHRAKAPFSRALLWLFQGLVYSIKNRKML